MKQSLEKFLEFNGKTLVFLSVEGTYYIAVKPVCEAINVEYTRIYKNLKSDPILGDALAVQPMHVPGDRVRKLVCLPEHLIYGWLFSIKSSSPELLEYKKECYEVLYNYFHSTITRRKTLFQEKAQIRTERSRLELTLRDDPQFVKLEDLRAREARIGKELKEMDATLLHDQLMLFKESD